MYQLYEQSTDDFGINSPSVLHLKHMDKILLVSFLQIRNPRKNASKSFEKIEKWKAITFISDYVYVYYR